MSTSRMFRNLILLALIVGLATTACAPAATPEAEPGIESVQAVPTDTDPTPPTDTQVAPTAISEEQTETSVPTISPVGESLPQGAEAAFEPGTALQIVSIWMMDLQHGWSVGGPEGDLHHILVTDDGGQTWRNATPPEEEAAPISGVAAAFLDAGRGWVSFSHQPSAEGFSPVVVWRTEDGGMTWTPGQPLDVSGFLGYYGPSMLGFADDQHGWLLFELDAAMMHRYVAIYTTADGGANWTRVVDPSSGAPIQTGDKTGLVLDAGGRGLLTRDLHGLTSDITVEVTRDGGRTWESVLLDVPAAEADIQQFCAVHSPVLYSPQSWAVSVSCVVFNEEGQEGEDVWLDGEAYLFRTEDGGVTWDRFDAPGGETIYFDGDVVLSLGREIHRSEDGGRTWQFIKTVFWDAAFSFISPERGWAAAYSDGERALVETGDGGRSWYELQPQSP